MGVHISGVGKHMGLMFASPDETSFHGQGSTVESTPDNEDGPHEGKK